MAEGWIKLHRKIQNNWIFEDSQYFKAWIVILMTVNYEPKKVFIHGELIDCERGQSLLSLQSWSKELGKKWTIQRVRTFFELLKKDSMIITEGLKYTTRLTVCKYEDYQETQQTENILTTNSKHSENILITTTKESKEDKEIKESKENKSFAAKAATLKRRDEFYDSLKPFIKLYTPEMIRAFFNHWSELNKSGLKMKFELQSTWETGLRLNTWMKNERPKNNKQQTPQYSSENLFN